MATIRKKGDYQWHVQIRKKGWPAQTKTFTHRADAEAWASDIERQMRLGTFVDRSTAEKTTIKELIGVYREKELPAKRGNHFGHALGVLEDHFGKYAVASITSPLVVKFKEKRIAAGLSASTIRKEINLLSRMLDLGAKEWGIYIPMNPCKMVSRPPAARTRRRRPTEEELKYLYRSAGKPLQLITRFAIATGARLGELLALEKPDIDTADHTCSTMTLYGIDRQGLKNGDEMRVVPLFAEAVQVLKELKKLPSNIDGRIFYWWKASDSFTKSWTRAKTRAQMAYLEDNGIDIPTDFEDVEGTGDATPRKGRKSIKSVNQANKRARAKQLAIDRLADGFLSDLRFHDMRHEAASRFIEQGKSIEEVMAILGHKTVQMSHEYAKLNAKSMAKRHAQR